MKVLFIIPPHPSRHTSVKDGMPLGVLYLASMIRDHEIRIIDAFSHPDSDFQNKIEDFQPDIVSISIPFKLVEKSAVKISEVIRRISGAQIIIGGIHATLAYDRIKKTISHDYFIPGEGEFAFEKLIDYLSGKFGDFPEGVLKNSDEQPVLAQKTLDINKLPFPARDLLENRDSYTERILASRGCGFRCGFCSSRSFWGDYRSREPDKIIDEIEQIYEERGTVPISFADDSFTYSRDLVENLCDRLIEREIESGGFGFSSHPLRLDEELLEKMWTAGFNSFFLGLESGSLEILNKIGKRYNYKKIEHLVKFAINLGFDIHASFMIGLPGESKKDIESTLTMAQNLPLNSIGFHIFYPFEGSPIRDNPEKYGIKIMERDEHDGDIDGEAIIHNGELTPNEILDYYYRARALMKRKHKA
ncbi:MAG: radical SAM protein [bacterium]